jgi:signal transduction histidine kinase
MALLVLAGLLLLRQLGLWPGDAIVWPLVLGSSGLALVARQAWGGGERAAGREPAAPVSGESATATPREPGAVPGGVLGAVLIVGAALVFLEATGTLHALRQALVGIVVVVIVLALVFGPWMVRQARALAAERSERIRSQERAELAAHLHDSVLQTLALIQRRAGDPRTVSTLARRQERELRAWLSGESARAPTASLAAALTAAAQEVEELHGVDVEVVTVGDCPLDDRLAALVQAVREALANAARFSGADKVDLYAEVTNARASVFVRDRGAGFDPAAVPADRRGVRESIVGRMERHRGHARVQSAPGAGTEVELTMERDR